MLVHVQVVHPILACLGGLKNDALKTAASLMILNSIYFSCFILTHQFHRLLTQHQHIHSTLQNHSTYFGGMMLLDSVASLPSSPSRRGIRQTLHLSCSLIAYSFCYCWWLDSLLPLGSHSSSCKVVLQLPHSISSMTSYLPYPGSTCCHSSLIGEVDLCSMPSWELGLLECRVCCFHYFISTCYVCSLLLVLTARLRICSSLHPSLRQGSIPILEVMLVLALAVMHVLNA